MRSAVITGSGVGLPERVVTNEELAGLMDTADEWIVSRSGIRERRLADAGVGSSHLATVAGRTAMSDAGATNSDIDAVVVATMTPDTFAPGIAAVVQDRLGLESVPAFDIRQQCSGFLYALDMADSLVKAEKADRVLVIGAEVHAGLQPWIEDYRRTREGGAISHDRFERNTRHRGWSVLFGDGAGAVVVESSDDRDAGVLGAELHTDGSLADLIEIPNIGSLHQPFVSADDVARDEVLPTMDGRGLYRQAVRRMPEAVRSLADRLGLPAEEVDLVVAHQANERILEGVRKGLGVDEETLPSNIDRYGNTTAGTLPILFHEMRMEGRVGPGTLVAFTAFGAGAHWGALFYREPS